MTFSVTQLFLAGVVLVLCNSGCVWTQISGTPSPRSEFLTSPTNTTVPEGEQAVLKCLVGSQVHVCRWYFLEWGLDFFDPRVTPMLIKDFSPTHHRDCSIRIKKVRKIQEGQWLCQALKFHTSKFLMTYPAHLKVITKSESETWTPPTPIPTPRQSRHDTQPVNTDDAVFPGSSMEFETSQEDYIQNADLGDSVILKCRVNMPISSCSWVMPHGAFFNLSQDSEDSNKSSTYAEDYRLEGDLSEGNCTLRVTEVQLQDEGDWRCVVQAGDHRSQGPLLHLHLRHHNGHPTHSHEGTPLVDPVEEPSVNPLIIVLVVTCSILIIIVILLFTCLYRRANNNSEETRKILQGSPRGSFNLACKTLPSTDLTAASVLAVEVRNKRPLPLQRYNPYLDMTGGDSSGDGYIIMPNSSLRSSTSSRTTLSTLSIQSGSRSRSASSSTTLSADFPHLITLVDNPSYTATQLTRPDSLYNSDHIYEEIKEKDILDKLQKMEKIPEVTTPVTPTYTNLVSDVDGYLIPKNSSSQEALVKQKSEQSPELPPPNPVNFSPIEVPPTELPPPNPVNFSPIEVPPTELPPPNPVNFTPTETSSDEVFTPSAGQQQNLVQFSPPEVSPAEVFTSSAGQAPPYSRVGECGLVPAGPTQPTVPSPGPGYSRVGSVSPEERYDRPRPLLLSLMEGYDVPRSVPTEVAALHQPNIPQSTELNGATLTGTIV